MLNEISEAHHYFKKLGTQFNLTVAYLNDYNLSRDFLTGMLPQNQISMMGKELLLSYIDNLIHNRPSNYVCPQFSILAIDEFCNVLTCCLVAKGHPDYSLGSLFDLTHEKIRQGKISRAVCLECGNLGIDYWVQTVPDFPFLRRLTGEGLTVSEIIQILEAKLKHKARQWFGKSKTL